MAGITSLRNKTALADASGHASWNGANGIKEQITELTDLLQSRGVKVVADFSTLAALTGADTNLVAVKGVALYSFHPLGTTSNPLDYPASGGGRWEFLCALGKTTYSEIIGDSIATVFTIEHNLNTISPTIMQLEPFSPGGGAPYSISTDAEISIVDENSYTLTYLTPPASYQFTIVTKK